MFASLPDACTLSNSGAYGSDLITQLTYDLAGQKLVETRGVGTSIAGPYATYTYSLDGNLATVLDGNNNLTTNLYDGLNRLSKVEYPLPTIGSGASNADSDDAAHLFRDDRAHHSEMMPPIGGAFVGGLIWGLVRGFGQACDGGAERRKDSPLSSMRWALWTRRSRMASA